MKQWVQVNQMPPQGFAQMNHVNPVNQTLMS